MTSPQLSLVMPCYNEEEIVAYTVERLLDAFRQAGVSVELVAVNNGSVDRTGEILMELSRKHPEVVYHRVERNQGYGHGVMSGATRCTAPWIGFIPADGQVDAEDVVHLYQAVAASLTPVIAKVRRRFRMDGLLRKVVSTSYNVFMLMLWPRIGTLDVNGVPKLLPRETFGQLDMQSRNWLFDAELMIKARHLGIRVLEFNVFARMRGGGLSHVRASTCWEFFRALLRMRFSGEMRRWQRAVARQAAAVPDESSRTRMLVGGGAL
jgi:glycosyltransferase involved in cell wall biosynthesis